MYLYVSVHIRKRERETGFPFGVRYTFVKKLYVLLANGVLQKKINDLCLLKKQEQQPHSFESPIKRVLFLALSLFISVKTEVHNKRLN